MRQQSSDLERRLRNRFVERVAAWGGSTWRVPVTAACPWRCWGHVPAPGRAHAFCLWALRLGAPRQERPKEKKREKNKKDCSLADQLLWYLHNLFRKLCSRCAFLLLSRGIYAVARVISTCGWKLRITNDLCWLADCHVQLEYYDCARQSFFTCAYCVLMRFTFSRFNIFGFCSFEQ